MDVSGAMRELLCDSDSRSTVQETQRSERSLHAPAENALGGVTDVQQLVSALQEALGVRVKCGQITLNMNENRVDSVETKVKFKPRAVDKPKGAGIA